MPEFEWNDETVTNSYGFRVRNSGSFKRFDANPVMQNSHINTTEANLGKWKDRRQDGTKLFGSTIFDSVRPEVATVEGQVDREFIKGCSMGLSIPWGDDTIWEVAPDGVWELIKWELMEVSICAIPSNSSALALYNADTKERIPEDQIKLCVQNLSAQEFKNNKNPTMDKITLSTDAAAFMLSYGFNNGGTNVELSAAVAKLKGEYDAEKLKAVDLQAKLTKQIDLQADNLGKQFVLEGKGTAEEAKTIVENAKQNFELTAMMVSKMPKKVSLSGSVETPEGGDSGVKTQEDFFKLTTEKQLAFKNQFPDQYAKLWN